MMTRHLLHAAACAAVLTLPVSAFAADTPVAGRRLTLKAEKLSVLLKDASIAAPFPDPSQGARLIVSGGAQAGHCYAEVELDPAGWQPLPRGGWRYRPVGPEPGGVRKVVIRNGRIVISAKGDGWPCDLSAASQRVPVTVHLAVDDVRYCAAFGGTVKRNQPGRFAATNAPPPVECAEKNDVTVVNLNLLHGLFCGGCRLPDRVDLFFDWIEGSACPDVVTLQEIHNPLATEIAARLGSVCPFTYEMVWGLFNLIDDAIVLSRYPIEFSEVHPLHIGFRNVLYARIDHPTGPLDVFTTHLASGSDGANSPCGAGCPIECVNAGATTIRECQSVQTAQFVEARHDVPTPALVTGDFNSEPGDFEYLQMTDRGWLDTYVVAGATCDPGTGFGCGSNRDSSLADLESTAVTIDERIDFIFLVPPQTTSCTVDSQSDDDGDGVATSMWADLPNPFATCGPLPDPICWPSDHNGNQLDLECS